MITTLGFALGALLLIVPMIVAQVFGLNISSKIISAFFKMLMRIGVLGAAMYILMQSGSVAFSLLFALFIIVYYIVTVMIRARLKMSLFIVPVGVAMFVAIVIVGSVLLFANVAIGSDFCVRYVVPVVSLLSGCIVNPVAEALALYYMGLRHHNHLYYYLIGNGASHAEALRYLQRRALSKSMVPGIRTMSMLAAGVSPVVLWIMIVCGASVVDAAAVQVLVVLAVFAASVIATIVALNVASRYVIDGYAMLRIKDETIKAAEKQKEQPVMPTQEESCARETIEDEMVSNEINNEKENK